MSTEATIMNNRLATRSRIDRMGIRLGIVAIALAVAAGSAACDAGTANPAATQAAECRYDVVDEWNGGYKAEISIVNDGAAFSDWELRWSWGDDSTFRNGWNASFDCGAGTCTATPPDSQPTIEGGATYTFGYINDKQGAAADTTVTVNGSVCDGSAASGDLQWRLDGAQSTLQYVSIKKDHTAENNAFVAADGEVPALSGSIDAAGNALLAINLNDVSTGIDIRDSRLLNLLFETEFLPTAYVHTQIDAAEVADMAPGETRTATIEMTLSLHGVQQALSAQVLIARLSDTELRVSSLAPVNVDAKAFDMDAGIEALRAVANLTSIGESVPVYFHLVYTATDDASGGLSVPPAPAAPGDLTAYFDADTATAELSWLDDSDNETLFVVRRRSVGGRWSTTAELATDTSRFSEALPEPLEYDYKLIALNNSMPSAPSNIETVTVTAGNPVVMGQSIYQDQCASCHGDDGEGADGFPPINTERDVESMISLIETSMPRGNPQACDRQCAEDVTAFIQTLWVTEVACDPSLTPVRYGARQLKILTRAEYQNSVEDLLGVDFDAADGLSEDAQVGYFANNTRHAINPSAYSNYLLVAGEIAQWSAEQGFSTALSCNGFDQACADTFMAELAPRIFRRPLTSDEVAVYAPMAEGEHTDGDVKRGIQMALEGMLAAPQFLYRHELGAPNPNNPQLDTNAFELTSYEMATFLAYTFTSSTPDDLLLDAAARDELRNPQQIMRHAQRLTDQAEDVMGAFVGSWLGTKDLDLAAKDEAVWPGFPALVPHMKAEISATFSAIMLDPGEAFRSLYAGNFSFLNETLANHYGIPGVSGSTLRRVETTNRGGILANGGFMARWGEAVETSPILRSVRVRRRMLCQEQPDPPAGTFAAREQKLEEMSEFLQDPETTNRMKYHRLTEDAPCTSCHLEYINPLGFGMEDFDTLGRIREKDLNGNLIDASGELFAPLDYSDINESVPFTGARGLGATLSTLPSAQACLPKQMFRYVTGVGHSDIDSSNPESAELAELERAGYACEVDELTETMLQDSPRAMLERFPLLDAVRYRKAWPRDGAE